MGQDSTIKPFLTAHIAFFLSLVSFVLICVWILCYYNGPKEGLAHIPFNYHPLSMSLAFAVFMSNALIVWREEGWFPVKPERPVRKALHAIFNGLAVIFLALGLGAVFESHAMSGSHDMYSIHSWIGMGAVGLTAIMWVISFLVFVYPTASDENRATFLTYHRFWGLVIYGMGIASCITGLVEKETGNLNKTPSETWSLPAMVANVSAIVFLLTGVSVYFQIWTSKHQVPNPSATYQTLN